MAALEEEALVLERATGAPDFWNDNDKAQTVLKRIRRIRDLVDTWQGLSRNCNEIAEMIEMARDEGDESLQESLLKDAQEISQKITEMELRKMLDGPDDAFPAIMTIHPGSGGTESADWASMLLRMYIRFFEREGYEFKVVDLQDGEEAGIKSATIELNSEYSYGMLRSEIGVHRLVRISPFDANARRHTSFAAVYLYPVIDDIEVEINPADLRVDTYRASGAGGQHINKTDSAVRITHIPTGLVAACQTERSQIQNRETAMKVIKAMVAQHFREIEDAKRNERMAGKQKIEWGSQIRSYVLQPYQMVKDLRTGEETSDTGGVLDGGIKRFINAYLLSGGGNS